MNTTDDQTKAKRMQATAHMASVVSSTPPARRCLIRSVRQYMKSLQQTVRTLLLLCLVSLHCGCRTRTWTDSWQPEPVPEGSAWHNSKFQQTAIDVNSDGRVDRLRFWRGSGTASELHDTNRDGWFDELVHLSYERERERLPYRSRVPSVPVTGSTGSFPYPQTP
jgi:hypothetical protein